VRYVDDNDQVTQAYPFNPNGSPSGIAGLCSKDGRHLAMMPHPGTDGGLDYARPLKAGATIVPYSPSVPAERCVLSWQCPYLPAEWQAKQATPWLKMFTNAAEWCQK